MNRAIVCAAVLIASAVISAPAAESTPEPLSPQQAVAAMKLPDGFRATLFAAEPEVVQPIGFCLDDRGRLFVAEALNYAQWQPTGNDRVIILADTDGDGRADSRKLFYEGFNYITGIEVGFRGVWVMSPPNLYFIPDRDGDDVPDGEPQVLFDGFGHEESRHNLANGFTWGPDGWLYGGHGRTSPSDVGRPRTPDAERVHCDGGVYRIHPTRLVFENFADGTTNPWGVDFDDFGQCFVSNCVNPHLFHMIQGGHYEPWRNRPSSLYAYERLPTCADHLHYPSDQPSAMRGETEQTLAMGGGHAHCGTLVYLGDNFPAEFRNTILMCNVHGRRINHDLPRRKGSGYSAEHGRDLMIAGDPWFMGVTLRTGPDGSVFVSDWSDTGECHTYKPNKHTGRIFKISHGQPRPVGDLDVARLADGELVKLQLHANDWYVRHARRVLQERWGYSDSIFEATVYPGLRRMLAEEAESPRRLRALWALHVTNGLDRATLLDLLADRQEHIRAWSIQLLCERNEPGEAALEEFAEMARSDPSPVVRLYLAAALQRLPLESRWPIAAGLLGRGEDAEDANLPLMIWYGIEPLVPTDAPRAFEFLAATPLPKLRLLIARRAASGEGAIERLELAAKFFSEERPAAIARDVLSGVNEAIRGRRDLKPPASWSAARERLLAAGDELRPLALRAGLWLGDVESATELLSNAGDDEQPAAARREALQDLIERRQAELPPLLLRLLDDRELRDAALRGLAAFDHPDAPAQILERYAGLSFDDKQSALAALAARPAAALELLDAVRRQQIPRGEISAATVRQLQQLSDDRVDEQLTMIWGVIGKESKDRAALIRRYRETLTPAALAEADPSRGRAVYVRSCAKCHKLFGEGGSIGPDITGSGRANLDYLLENILDPSALVPKDFQLTVLATADGRVISGLVLEETDATIKMQTQTEVVVLPLDEIEQRKRTPQSMMPDGLLTNLSAEQVRDLFRYLASPQQVPLPAAPNGP